MDGMCMSYLIRGNVSYLFLVSHYVFVLGYGYDRYEFLGGRIL